ncbi:MAG TPA: hypothetical protein VF414_11900, partial [Thermoanaerobaculia bacterium]
VWTGQGYCNIRFNFCSPTDGEGSAVFAQRFGPAVPAGGALLVNVHWVGNQGAAAVSVSPLGGFTVVWRSDGEDRPGVLGRSFGAQGEPGPEFQISSRGEAPQIAHGPDGEILIVWMEKTSGLGGPSSLYAALFDAGGLPLGRRHRINDSVSASRPVLAVRPGGGYVVGWVESAVPSGAAVVRARHLDADGWPEGPSAAMSFPPEDLVDLYDLTVDETGGILVAWEGVRLTGAEARQGIFATYLDAGGNALWRSQPLSEERAQAQRGVRVASDGRRALAVSWFSQIPDPVYPAVDYFVRRLVLPGGACGGSPSHLCLQGRFSVEARWRGSGETRTGGDGLAVPYSASTGFFAMSDPAGWDLGVKILDTRARNQHFALYEGNLCEPESWIRTVDTVTGFVRVDHSAGGQPCGQRDSRAFDASVVSKAVRPCRPGPATLCLLGGRFLVRARWKPVPTGPPQLARAVSGSDRSGLFWFYAADNPAIVVQMVDGRDVNGHFWVLHSGFTPRDYTLTVTDLATGLGKTFSYSAADTCGRIDRQAF